MQPYWQHEHSHNLVIMSLYRTPFHRYTRIGSTARFTTATGSFNQPIYPWYQANLHSSEAVITSTGAHTADATGFNRCNIQLFKCIHICWQSYRYAIQLYHSTIYSHSSDFTSSTMAIGGFFTPLFQQIKSGDFTKLPPAQAYPCKWHMSQKSTLKL